MPKTNISIRIDWSELDLFGHVNNVMFVKYVQSSRVNFFEDTGLLKHFEETKHGPILASLSCRFIRPIHYPGDIQVQASVAFIKNTSFGLRHVMYDDNKQVVAEADDVIVFYDFGRDNKIEIPGWLRAKLEE